MNKQPKQRNRGIAIKPEGLALIENKMSNLEYDNNKLSEVTEISIDTINALFQGEKKDKKTIQAIAKALDLNPTDIVDADEWYRQSKNTAHNHTDNDFWLKVCHTKLDNQQEHIRKNASAMRFELDFPPVPLGLVERKDKEKQQPRGDDNQEKKPKIYEHNDFLEQVINKNPAGKNKHISIVGEPGAGKTTLLTAIASYIKNENKELPIVISLGSLQGMTLEEYILKKWLPDTMRFTPTSEIEEQLKTRFYKGGVWLLLDGVDEMGESSPIAALNKISQALTDWLGKARVVLTCRLNVWDANPLYNDLSGFDTYKTQEFKPEQIDQFIEEWFKCDNKIQRGEELKTKLREPGKERIRELVTNPLRLCLLCQIFYQDKHGELPETKAGLFDLYAKYFYYWKSTPETQELRDSHDLQKELHQVLGKLALSGINGDARFRMDKSFVVEVMTERLFNLADKVGWLNLVDADVYAFFHPNFQEYFAALVIDDWDYFLNHNNANPNPFIQYNNQDCVYRIFESKWKEVILLWFGRNSINKDDKEDFIEALVSFESGCDDFYFYPAYFLAATAIAQFAGCRIASEIIQELVKLSYYHRGDDYSEYWEFYLPISYGASNTLIEANLSQSIDCIINEIENTNDEYIHANFVDILIKIAHNNSHAINVVIDLIRKYKGGEIFWREYKKDDFVKFGKNNLELTNYLIDLIKTEDDIGFTVDFLIKISPDNTLSIDVLCQAIQVIEKGEMCFYCVESLVQIDPSNPKLITGICKIIYDFSTYGMEFISMLSEIIFKINKQLQMNLIKELENLISSNTDENICFPATIVLTELNSKHPLIIPTFIELLQSSSNSIIIRNSAVTLFEIGEFNKDYEKIIIAILFNIKGKRIFTRFSNFPEIQEDSFLFLLGEYPLKLIKKYSEMVISELVRLNNISDNESDKISILNQILKIQNNNSIAIHCLLELMESSISEDIVLAAAKSILKFNFLTTSALSNLLKLAKQSHNESIRREAALMLYTTDKDKYIDTYISTLEELIQFSPKIRTRLQSIEDLNKIDSGNTVIIDGILDIIHTYNKDKSDISYIELPRVFTRILQISQMPRVVYELKNYISEYTDTNSFIKFATSYEILWYCAQNMTYSEFYRAWHGKPSPIQNLETQFIDSHSHLSQLQPTEKTYPLTLNLKTLQNETDIIEISQEICNQIYFTACPENPEIPQINNAPQLKSKIPQIKKHLQTENLALIINNCEPNQEMIKFCNKLTDVLHIAFITEQPLDAPLKGFPNQSNLLNVIQHWINEI
ncbi:MAG: NACHT domain-containing protein [Dolichospermum sp. DL01]|nr:MAG: NACHT domain-containing protein [Dolichospermum sp. DL01]